ncbi:MAG: BamA/TamA family outer membrane protein [Candidatus Eisenbacteria bacterium]|nr:BamA/TamA family outer membrane protein [Candidatus Eisenbacteria bacterium]
MRPALRGAGLAAPAVLSAVLLAAGLACPGPARAASEVAGEFLQVARVSFEGNETFGSGELRKFVRTQTPSFPFHPFRRSIYRRDFIRGDADALAAFYRRRGYLDVAVEDRTTTDPEAREVEVAFVIREGRRYLVGTVGYAGVTQLEPPLPAQGSFLRTGDPYNPFARESERERLGLLYADVGCYPQVHDTAAVRDSTVDVRFAVAEGPPVHVRRITHVGTGPLHNRPFVIRGQMDLEPGSLLSRSTIEADKSRLYAADLFEDVQIVPVNADSVQHTVDVEVRVRERKPWWLSGGVGYGSQDQFRLLSEVGTRSLFWTGRRLAFTSMIGYGRRPYLDANAFKFQEARLELALTEPHLLGTRTRGQVSLYFVAQPDTTLPHFTRGVSVDLRRELTPTSKLLAQFSHYGVTSHPRQEPAFYTSNRFQLGFDRDMRDNAFDPSRGSYQDLTVQLSGGVLGGNTAFFKNVGSASWYRPLRGRTVLAARLRAGVAMPFHHATGDSLDLQMLRAEDRFRTGGANTVRGYSEEEIGGSGEATVTGHSGDAFRGGRVLLLAGAEVRFPIWGLFSGALFLDGGAVWRSFGDVTLRAFAPYALRGPASFDRFRYSAGGGLRFATPVGPFRVDYGVKINPPELGELPSGVTAPARTSWHFSLGQAY